MATTDRECTCRVLKVCTMHFVLHHAYPHIPAEAIRRKLNEIRDCGFTCQRAVEAVIDLLKLGSSTPFVGAS